MPTISPIDLSHPLDSTNLTLYPGDPPLKCCPSTTIDKDGYSVHSLSLGSHTGTHIDAPSHFILNGLTIDQIPLSTLIGRALIIDLTHKKPNEKITCDPDLASYSAKMSEEDVQILLLRTGWSAHWATSAYLTYPYLDRHAAEQIMGMGIQVLGVDTLSPDAIDGPDGYGAHEVILGTGGIIAENLTNLEALSGSGKVMVSLVPLNITGCDGSPVRAYGWSIDQD